VRSKGTSPKVAAAGSLSKTVCFRGRKSVAEKTGAASTLGAVKIPAIGIDSALNVGDGRK